MLEVVNVEVVGAKKIYKMGDTSLVGRPTGGSDSVLGDVINARCISSMNVGDMLYCCRLTRDWRMLGPLGTWKRRDAASAVMLSAPGILPIVTVIWDRICTKE